MRLLDLLKRIRRKSGAKGAVDAPQDETSSDNLLRKDFLSHFSGVEEDGWNLKRTKRKVLMDWG